VAVCVLLSQAIFLSLEHERIHIETSSVLIRQLPLKCIKGQPSVWVNAPPAAGQFRISRARSRRCIALQLIVAVKASVAVCRAAN
jgi:hypothetical protein